MKTRNLTRSDRESHYKLTRFIGSRMNETTWIFTDVSTLFNMIVTTYVNEAICGTVDKVKHSITVGRLLYIFIQYILWYSITLSTKQANKQILYAYNVFFKFKI